MGPQSDRKACWDRLAGQKTMMVADTRRFDFENGRSVQANNPCVLCGRISDTGLYSFCYRRISLTSEKFYSHITARVVECLAFPSLELAIHV